MSTLQSCFRWLTRGVWAVALSIVPLCAQARQKTGILLVNHGSRSATWRGALQEVERKTQGALLASGVIHGVKTAFMEYTEPSIATQVKAFDAEGYTDVVVVPLFLTVSSHTFDDIPTILGRKTDSNAMQMLKIEGIERYTPRARTHFAPLLDFSGLLKENVLRRAKALSKRPGEEGLVLIAYGDATYEKRWSTLLEQTAQHVLAKTGMKSSAYGWCGHLVSYDPAQTTRAVEQVLKTSARAIVIPVLVAHDEMFQVKIIGGGIARVADHARRVAYLPDAILPDPLVNDWVIRTAIEWAKRVQAGGAAR